MEKEKESKERTEAKSLGGTLGRMEERERLRAWERFAQNEGLLGSGGIRQPRLCAPRLEAERVLAGGVGGRRLELLRLSPILGVGVVVESKYFLFFLSLNRIYDLPPDTAREPVLIFRNSIPGDRHAYVQHSMHGEYPGGIAVFLYCLVPGQVPAPSPASRRSLHCHLCPPHWASVPCSDPLRTRGSGPSGIWLVSCSTYVLLRSEDPPKV